MLLDHGEVEPGVIHEEHDGIGCGHLLRARIDVGHVQLADVALLDVGVRAANIGTEAEEKFGDSR